MIKPSFLLLFLHALAHCSFAISKMSCRTQGKIVSITCCRYTWQNWSIQAKTGLVFELSTLPLTNELSSGKHMLSSNTQSSHFSMPITNESDILWNEERQKMNGILLLGPGLFCHRKEIKYTRTQIISLQSRGWTEAVLLRRVMLLYLYDADVFNAFKCCRQYM